MKRRVLKGWVVDVLGLISFIALLFSASECENLILFIGIKLIGLSIIGINMLILYKYTDLMKGSD